MLLILFDPICFQLISDMLLVLDSAQTSAQMTFWAGDRISLALCEVSRDDGMAASGVNQTEEPEEEEIINCVAIFYDEGKKSPLLPKTSRPKKFILMV